MNKVVLGLVAAMALGNVAIAGDNMKDLRTPVIEERVETETSLFRDNETSFDVFGLYVGAIDRGVIRDGFGGGIGMNHFFTRHFGVGIEGDIWENNDDVAGNANASLIARYPMEFLGQALAPYIFGGGGAVFAGGPEASGHGGGGLEWRFNHNWSVFGDGRYVVVDNLNDYAMGRGGLRWIF
ncbi:MAG: hypothetical protein SGI71_10240 [Verrucomicrobiota bacterium]|nr:hypothetical protein [Verrucomicrobiota bacterium]